MRCQSPEEADQGSRTTLRIPYWEYTDLSILFSWLVHIIGIQTWWLNFIWKVIQPCLECDNKLLGNRRIIVFLVKEHLLGVQSNVEVHYQRLLNIELCPFQAPNPSPRKPLGPWEQTIWSCKSLEKCVNCFLLKVPMQALIVFESSK